MVQGSFYVILKNKEWGGILSKTKSRYSQQAVKKVLKEAMKYIPFAFFTTIGK